LETDIKIDFKEVFWDRMDWISLVQKRDKQ